MLPTPVFSDISWFDAIKFPDEKNRWKAHTHANFQFDCFLAGDCCLEVEGRPHHYRPNEIALIPPLVRHGYSTRRGFKIFMLRGWLHPFYLSHVSRDFKVMKFDKGWVKELETLADRHEDSYASISGQRILSLVSSSLFHFMDSDQSDIESDGVNDELRKKVMLFLEKIDREPEGNWTVAEMARSCHMSSDHFSLSFKRLVRHSPREYLLSARMRHAVNLLIRERLPIKIVAEKCGYANVHAFTRAFRKVHGLNPAEYRDKSEL